MFHLIRKTAITVGIASLCFASTANAVVTFNDSDTSISWTNAGTITAPTSFSYAGKQTGSSVNLDADGQDAIQFSLTNAASGSFGTMASVIADQGWASFATSLWTTADESGVMLAGGSTFTSVALNGNLQSSWSYSSLTPEAPYFLHFDGVTKAGSSKATYGGSMILSPVPEPETYAMLLAGLGLMGFVASRRKQIA